MPYIGIIFISMQGTGMSVRYISAAAFIAFLLIGFIFAVFAHFSSSFQGGDLESALKGKTSSAYEKEFDKNLKHRSVSIDAWNTAGFVLFEEGKKGVLIGQDGWLFTNEEFEYPEGFGENIQNNKKFILEVFEKLNTQNIKLVVVPVPSKARIYKHKLGKYNFPSYWEGQYQALISFLEGSNISSVNIFDIFEENKSENIYLKTDTHWTPLGARLASLKIDYYITSKFPYLSWPLTKFKSKKMEEGDYEGDLMRYTVNGASAEKFGLKKDHFLKWETVSTEDVEENLFGEVNIPVTLVGTSYSANKTWNFEGFLKEALGTDVLNVADEGLGPFEVMSNYLGSESYKNSKPKLIIWEMPERYLAMSSIDKQKEEIK